MRMQILVDKPPQQAPTLQTVQSYFDTFNDQYHCFEDLRVLIRQLAGDRIDSFLSHAVQSSSFSLDALTDVIRVSACPDNMSPLNLFTNLLSYRVPPLQSQNH